MIIIELWAEGLQSTCDAACYKKIEESNGMRSYQDAVMNLKHHANYNGKYQEMKSV